MPCASLRKAPASTTATVLAVALGIGVNVTVFSLVDSLLLRPLPLRDASRLVYVWEDASYVGFPRATPAPANYADWKSRNHVFTGMGALRGQIFAITGDGPPEQVEGNAVTADLFPVLGVTPVLGRQILPEEDRPGGARVALISHKVWEQRYGGDRDVLGRKILLDRVPYEIVGVMPDGFTFPDRSDVWVPLGLKAPTAAATTWWPWED